MQLTHPAFTVENTVEKGALLALQRQRHIYGGTVPTAEIAKRRKRNKSARKARRIARAK